MKTALLVIDAQKIYTSPESEMYCEDAEGTIKNINTLIKHFVDDPSLVIYIRHINKNDGSELGRMYDFCDEAVEMFDFVENTEEVEYDPKLVILDGGQHIVKNRYSAFKNTRLQDYLREIEVKCLVICGFMTNFCCDSTAREAHDEDYYVDFVVDATGTPGTENMGQQQIRSIVGEFLAEGYACIYTIDEYPKS